jgi:hypothetical protein
MKTILLFTCAFTLLATSGCLVSEGGGGRGHWHHRHSAVVVGPPEIILPVPVIVVH